ncbi:MAG: HD domain-containing protein [Nitrospirota bacterium]
MKRADLNNLKNWFDDYTRSFYSSDEEDQKNIYLKVEHTCKVCSNIIQIVKEHSSGQDEIMIAETIALFHDLGRFPQYAKYKTFKDSISVNHGRLGAGILEKERVLQNLPVNEQDLIINSVRFHNSFGIPSLQDDKAVFFLKLIRDADKLDIWRVFSEYFDSSENDRASAAGLGLPDMPEYSEEVLSCLFNKRMATLASLRTLNDFKLMQLSWIFDLNFCTSFRLLLERSYIERLSATLPMTDEIMKATMLLKGYSQERLTKD